MAKMYDHHKKEQEASKPEPRWRDYGVPTPPEDKKQEKSEEEEWSDTRKALLRGIAMCSCCGYDTQRCGLQRSCLGNKHYDVCSCEFKLVIATCCRRPKSHCVCRSGSHGHSHSHRHSHRHSLSRSYSSAEMPFSQAFKTWRDVKKDTDMYRTKKDSDCTCGCDSDGGSDAESDWDFLDKPRHITCRRKLRSVRRKEKSTNQCHSCKHKCLCTCNVRRADTRYGAKSVW